MKLLAIETATRHGSVALLDGDSCVQRAAGQEQSHTQHLAIAAQALLADDAASLDGYALDIGPGSFTGLRVGLSFLKGLCLAHPRPIFTAGSLELMAEADPGQRSLCALKARAGEVYFAEYAHIDGHRNIVQPPRVVSVDALAKMDTADAACIGDGWPTETDPVYPEAKTLAQMAARCWSQATDSLDDIVLNYIQVSGAERSAARAGP